MSQILRVLNFSSRLVNVLASSEAGTISTCKNCSVKRSRLYANKGDGWHCWLSTDSRALAPKQKHSKGKKLTTGKKRELIEDARTEQIKDMMNTIKKMKSQNVSGMNLPDKGPIQSAQTTVPEPYSSTPDTWQHTLERFKSQLPETEAVVSSSDSPTENQINVGQLNEKQKGKSEAGKKLKTESTDSSSKQMPTSQTEVNQPGKKQKRKSKDSGAQSKQVKTKKSKGKASLTIDTKKPILNESINITASEGLIPDVKTILSGRECKTKVYTCSLSKDAKSKALRRLLASHPFIEHMQTAGTVELNPDMVVELEEMLQDPFIDQELSENMRRYLDRFQTEENPNYESENYIPLNIRGVASQDSHAEELSTSVTSEVASSGPLWSHGDLNNSERIREITSEVVKLFQMNLSKQAKLQAIEHDKERKIDLYNREAAAYVEACVFTGMLKRAQGVLVGQTIQKKKRGRRKTHRKVTDAAVYNSLMHAWAKQGKLEPIRELFDYMEREGVSPTLPSYGMVLLCLSKQKELQPDLIQKVMEDIGDQGLNISDINLDSRLPLDEQKNIEKVMKLVKSDFTPNKRILDNLSYDCQLVDELNECHNSVSNPYSGVLSTEDLRSKAKEQMTLELSDQVKVKSILPKVKVTTQIKKARKLLDDTRSTWKFLLRQGLKRNISYMEQKAKEDHTTSNILPYLRLFPLDTYVDIMLQQIAVISQEMESFSPPISYLHNSLGYTVYHKLVLLLKEKHKQVDQIASMYNHYLQHYNQEETTQNFRQFWHRLESEWPDSITNVSSVSKWPNHVSKSVGRFLMSVIMNEVKINSNSFKLSDERTEIPAFYSVTRSRNNIPQEEIMPHPVLVRLYKEAHIDELVFRPEDMPSITPPVPWTAVNFGGNLLSTTDLIKNAPPQFDVHRKVPNRQLYPVFDAINIVSSVPWKINKPLLDVIVNVFNTGGDPKLDIPEPISKCPALPKFLPDMTPEERTAVIITRNRLKKKQKEMFSLWCTELYRLSIANKYRDEIFWFPHNLDFRSRFYAVPPHLNHLGSDVARSMLVFAKGKPLGPEGLDWLKIHLINLTGFKKRSPNAERLEYANSLMPDILDSAENPLTGRRWWQLSDEPWQTLACCIEITKASQVPEPDKYISNFPIHQDGSCNGLQHYAALGRDQSGAESVNLFPFHSPKDVYSDVVELVEKERINDAQNKNSTARILDGFVKRKVIKQTIMTTVYGVTKYGARQQIRGQLEDIADFPQKQVWDGMFYLTDKTFYCLQQMFTSTKQIQDWFVVCAELISRICYRPVEWVTPVGWPVLQPYYRHTYIRKPDQPDRSISVEKPNVLKQKNAFPPNFIHSLDSTHMMLTAIYCFNQGVNFVAVHDCFWTHAADVDIMNKVCREQFVALHKQPILEDLAVFLLEKYGFPQSELEQGSDRVNEAKAFVNEILGHLPERGSFDIDQVLDSTYFFS